MYNKSDFEKVIAKWTFCVQQFFSAKNSKVAITEKLRMQPLPFFSSPPFLLLAPSFSPFPFPVILELLGLKKPSF